MAQTLEVAAGFAYAHLFALGAFVTSAARRVPRHPPGHAISSLCHVFGPRISLEEVSWGLGAVSPGH